jgi:hypothetical protein
MKRIIPFLALAAGLFLASCNNDKKDDKAKTDDPGKIENTVKETPKTTLAAHVCTDQCKEGNHLYAHGEEGHTCSEACMKDHSCTGECKDGNHAYAHGEKGHTCASAECGKM